MEVFLRQENPEDHSAVFRLIEKAFSHEKISDHQEQYLVERLRKSKAFIPELSIVATFNNQIVGHILLTKIKIKNTRGKFDSLALAPVSVLPEFQNRGIGGKLISHAHEAAKKLGFQSVILLGHQDYYPRFGYKRADEFGIDLPFDVPKANCMSIELVENALGNVNGIVEYPQEFYD
ncbi:GNAT family N-acetyltransferase [Flexithrix dorotheae]|uniref:GNAT family N-acetyltransferase n=1 Tax=Flexithrix dorotheae TaxID=70993 RepID=UPI00037FDFE2|nr:N-acetyltransferase [Flexithrix dorotheae]